MNIDRKKENAIPMHMCNFFTAHVTLSRGVPLNMLQYTLAFVLFVPVLFTASLQSKACPASTAHSLLHHPCTLSTYIHAYVYMLIQVSLTLSEHTFLKCK